LYYVSRFPAQAFARNPRDAHIFGFVVFQRQATRPERIRQEDLLRDLVPDTPETRMSLEVGRRKQALGVALTEAFVRSGLSKAEVARRIKTGVASLNRLFDAGSYGACTATTLIKFQMAVDAPVFAPSTLVTAPGCPTARPAASRVPGTSISCDRPAREEFVHQRVEEDDDAGHLESLL
jgi:hypothetical protein